MATLSLLNILAASVVLLATLIFRYWSSWKQFRHGIKEAQAMSQDADAYYQNHEEHPYFHLPMIIVPSQTFIISPALIRKYYATPQLDYIHIKRELDISVFRMPKDCLPTSGTRSQTMTTIEHMFHAELAPVRLEEVMHRFTDQIYKHVGVLRQELGSEGKMIPINERFYEMMLLSAVTSFFGDNFPSPLVLPHLRHMAAHLATAIVPGQLPWPLSRLATHLLGTEGQDAFERVAVVCEDWLKEHGTAQASELVIRTEAMARASGWSNREIGIMMGMLMVTLVANSSDAAGWIILTLLQSPELLKTVKSEIKALPPSEDNPERPELNGTILASTCPYLTSSIQETLRLFTSVLSARIALEDTTLTAGGHVMHIKKNTRVIVPTRAMHVDKAVWGEDVGSWKGDRFYGEEGRKKIRDIAPWGGGSSACSGRHFANVELASIAVIFLSAFEFDMENAKVITNDGREIEAPTFEIIDLDGKEIDARWPGARADPQAVQSGVFRAGAQMTMRLRVKKLASA